MKVNRKISRIFCSVNFIFFSILFMSCNFYKSVGQMESYNKKTTIKPCTELNDPILIFDDIDEYLYLGGNENSSYIIENRGGAFYIYDWENNSIYDWVFIPTKRGLHQIKESASGQYYVFAETTWMPKKYSYIFDSHTGQITKCDLAFNDGNFYYSSSGCNNIPSSSKFVFFEWLVDDAQYNIKIFDPASAVLTDVVTSGLKYSIDNLSPNNIFYGKEGKAYLIYENFAAKEKPENDFVTDRVCLVLDLNTAAILDNFLLPLYNDIGEVGDNWFVSSDCKGLWGNYLVMKNGYGEIVDDRNEFGQKDDWLYFYDLTGQKNLQIAIGKLEYDENGNVSVDIYNCIEAASGNYILKHPLYGVGTVFCTLNSETENLDAAFEAELEVSSNMKVSGDKFITWSRSYDTIYCQIFDLVTKELSEQRSLTISDVRK